MSMTKSRIWKACAPLFVAIAIALCPAPEGLAVHAWYFFALFVGTIVGLVVETFPFAAIGSSSPGWIVQSVLVRR